MYAHRSAPSAPSQIRSLKTAKELASDDREGPKTSAKSNGQT